MVCSVISWSGSLACFRNAGGGFLYSLGARNMATATLDRSQCPAVESIPRQGLWPIGVPRHSHAGPTVFENLRNMSRVSKFKPSWNLPRTPRRLCPVVPDAGSFSQRDAANAWPLSDRPPHGYRDQRPWMGRIGKRRVAGQGRGCRLPSVGYHGQESQLSAEPYWPPNLPFP
jgi:hypothetical protein